MTDEEKNQYHLENIKAAEMCLVDINIIPKTHDGLKEWVIEKSRQKDYLMTTDVAEDVKDIIGGCLLYTSPSPRDQRGSRMPSSA